MSEEVWLTSDSHHVRDTGKDCGLQVALAKAGTPLRCHSPWRTHARAEESEAAARSGREKQEAGSGKQSIRSMTPALHCLSPH